MKQIVFIFLCFLCACKKKDIVPGNLRLISIIEKGGFDNTTSFKYDDLGRLVSMTQTGAGVTEIVYNGNQVTVNFPPKSFQKQKRVTYEVVGDKVSHRNSSEVTEITPPEGPQKRYLTETTSYEYNTEGSLVGYSGTLKDSMSFYPQTGVLQIQKLTVQYIAVSEIRDGNLNSVNRTYIVTNSVTESGTTSSFIISADEKTDFFFDKNYPNKFDFKTCFFSTNSVSILFNTTCSIAASEVFQIKL
jgi:YD repeat-containing protein